MSRLAKAIVAGAVAAAMEDRGSNTPKSGSKDKATRKRRKRNEMAKESRRRNRRK